MPQFMVQDVKVEYTDSYLSKEKILAISEIANKISLFQVDIKRIQKKLESYPPIRTAKILRLLPNRMKIYIVPETPVALVNTTKLHYMNKEGQAYRQVRAEDPLQFPLITTEKGVDLRSIPPERVQAALKIVDWSGVSTIIQKEDIGDIFFRNKSYQGMAPLQMTLLYPPSRWEKAGIRQQNITVSFGPNDLTAQLRRLETVLQFVQKLGKVPVKIRMELEKKVVVKIAQ